MARLGIESRFHTAKPNPPLVQQHPPHIPGKSGCHIKCFELRISVSGWFVKLGWWQWQCLVGPIGKCREVLRNGWVEGGGLVGRLVVGGRVGRWAEDGSVDCTPNFSYSVLFPNSRPNKRNFLRK